jgi:hypothetical protein
LLRGNLKERREKREDWKRENLKIEEWKRENVKRENGIVTTRCSYLIPISLSL